MKNSRPAFVCAAYVFAALLMLGNASARAQAPQPSLSTSAATPSPGIPMISGGIGDDELAYIKSIEHQFNLKLLFTEHNGMYLANVHVQIDDKAGHTLVSTVAKGPILLLKLPAGAYKITAAESGETHEQPVRTSGKSLASYVIRFRTEDTMKSE